jgi:hypothetical protein
MFQMWWHLIYLAVICMHLATSPLKVSNLEPFTLGETRWVGVFRMIIAISFFSLLHVCFCIVLKHCNVGFYFRYM